VLSIRVLLEPNGSIFVGFGINLNICRIFVSVGGAKAAPAPQNGRFRNGTPVLLLRLAWRQFEYLLYLCVGWGCVPGLPKRAFQKWDARFAFVAGMASI